MKRPALRIETFGDRIEAIRRLHPVTGKGIAELDEVDDFPGQALYDRRASPWTRRCKQIGSELEEQLALFRSQNKLLEAQRLEQRTRYDMEMLQGGRLCQRHRKLFAHS